MEKKNRKIKKTQRNESTIKFECMPTIVISNMTVHFLVSLVDKFYHVP